MSTRRVAITGIDGTGKTTLIRELSREFRDRPTELMAFRAPQYHETPDLPFAELSDVIQRLNLVADTERDPLLKATALFLSMTLYGDIERHVVETYEPDTLVTERQCLADSLAYTRFYLPLLRSALDRDRLFPKIREKVTEEEFRKFARWISVIHARESMGREELHLWEMPLYIRDLFSTEPKEKLLEALSRAYHSTIPDEIIVLQVPPGEISERLATRDDRKGPAEMHEKVEILNALQAGLEQSCEFLKSVRKDLKVTLVPTGGQSVEESVRAVIRHLGFS